jgi:hypothetical protein
MAGRAKSVATPRALNAEDVVNAAIAGLSHAAIARRFLCSVDKVRETLEQHAREVLQPSGRAAMLALEIARLEQLEAAFLRVAIEQSDAAAGTLVVKVAQRKAALLGLDQPAQVRLNVETLPRPEDEITNTQRMLEAIRALRANADRERPPVIDGQSEAPTKPS